MYSWHAEFPINTPLTPPPPSTPSSPQTLPHPHPPTPHRPSAPSQHSSQLPSPVQKTVQTLPTSHLHPASSPISSHHHLARRVRNHTSADRAKGTICADGWSGWSSWLRGRRLRGGLVYLMGGRLGGRVGVVVRSCRRCCDRRARRLAHLIRKVYLPSDDDEDDLASQTHLSGASSAPAVGVANGGYGT